MRLINNDPIIQLRKKNNQVNILPLLYRFMLNDMNILHLVVYKTIPVTMSDYLTLYSGYSRLHSTHIDNISFVSNIASTTTSISNLYKSLFFRYGAILPLNIINSQLKTKLAKHF